TVETKLARAQVGILFQDDALLPWKTARDNVALGLTFNGMERSKALAEAETWLERLNLAGFGDRFPRHLSGGQRKRVALAQVLAMRPKLILMDEPFASLHAIVAHAWCGTWSRWSSARGSAFYWSPMIWKRHSPSRTKSICYRKGRARTSPSITRCRFRARAIPSIRARIPPLRRSTSGCGRTS